MEAARHHGCREHRGLCDEVAERGFNQITPGDVIKGNHDTIFGIIKDSAGAGLAGPVALKLMRGSP